MADSRNSGRSAPKRPRVAGLRKRATGQRGLSTGGPDNGDDQSTGGKSSETGATQDVGQTPEVPEAPTGDNASAVNAPDSAGARGTVAASETVGTSGTHESGEPQESVDTVEAGQTAEASDTAVRTGEAGATANDIGDAEPEGSADSQRQNLVIRNGVVEVGSDDDVQRDPPAERGVPSTDGAERSAARTDRAWLLPTLAALTVVGLVLSAFFLVNLYSVRSQGASSNQALVDPAATSQVNGQVKDAVSRLFSYNYADTAKTEQAARDLLVGQAVREYEQLFRTIKQEAPKQQLVVTTTVKASGVSQLQGDRAQVLLFVDQESVRTNSGETNVGPAQLSVAAEKHGEKWKISKITQR